jgi:IS5 family transposase
VRRPKNNVDQRDNYSGKKKRHTSKLLVVSDENKRVTIITPVYVGKSHDFAILKEENLAEVLPKEKPVYTDTGFEGIDKLREDIDLRKPKKKRRNRKLNGGERLGNRIISRERVKVEHSIGGIKRFKIVANIFRGITHSMDRTFEIASGLWNLHLQMHPQT